MERLRHGRRPDLLLSLPVMMKEMRSRMRGWRAPTLLFLVTALTIGIALLVTISDYGHYWPEHSAVIGHALFARLITCQAVLAAFLTPALTAGCITIEKEQQTLEMLLLTRLSCRNILLGKLCASLSFLVLLLLCGLPVLALSFLLGGVAPAQLLWAQAIILATVIFFGSIALYCSAHYARTATAMAAAYGYCILWVIVPPILLGLFFLTSDAITSESFYLYFFTDDILKTITPYFIYAIFANAILALYPAAALSILCGAIIRRALSRRANFLLWLFIAGGGAYALLTYAAQIYAFFELRSANFFWGLMGNPAVALFMVFQDDMFTHMHSRAVELFIPVAVVCALLIITQAARALQRLRDAPTPAGARRKTPRTARPPTPHTAEG